MMACCPIFPKYATIEKEEKNAIKNKRGEASKKKVHNMLFFDCDILINYVVVCFSLSLILFCSSFSASNASPERDF